MQSHAPLPPPKPPFPLPKPRLLLLLHADPPPTPRVPGALEAFSAPGGQNIRIPGANEGVFAPGILFSKERGNLALFKSQHSLNLFVPRLVVEMHLSGNIPFCFFRKGGRTGYAVSVFT